MVTPRDIADRVQRINDSGVRGSSGSDDEKRQPAARAIAGDAFVERRGNHPQLLVDRHQTDSVAAKTRCMRHLVDRLMPLG
jgi:hypothetical protein